MYNRLRFTISETAPDSVRVRLEKLGGEELEAIEWTNDQSAEQLFVQIAEILQRHAIYPGDESFDVARMLRQLATTVEVGTQARTGRGGPRDLGPVIEVFGPQWSVTEDGIEAIGRRRYVIERYRVDSPSWYPHVSAKSWVDDDEFEIALETARMLFSQERPDENDPFDS